MYKNLDDNLAKVLKFYQSNFHQTPATTNGNDAVFDFKKVYHKVLQDQLMLKLTFFTKSNDSKTTIGKFGLGSISFKKKYFDLFKRAIMKKP